MIDTAKQPLVIEAKQLADAACVLLNLTLGPIAATTLSTLDLPLGDPHIITVPFQWLPDVEDRTSAQAHQHESTTIANVRHAAIDIIQQLKTLGAKRYLFLELELPKGAEKFANADLPPTHAQVKSRFDPVMSEWKADLSVCVLPLGGK